MVITDLTYACFQNQICPLKCNYDLGEARLPAVFLIGLDFGTESARGVLIDVSNGRQQASHTHAYRHGVMTRQLPNGQPLPSAFALQDASDYVEAAEGILKAIGSGRTIAGIGIGFTASSPLPVTDEGIALSALHPEDPHAFVKLWKHAAAQPYADLINQRGGAFLANFGNRLSGEWLMAKAAQIEAEAPNLWAKAGRFIEAGDWLVWQLTGRESRSLDFAAYKAQFSEDLGYPSDIVPGLGPKLGPVYPVGTSAGFLSAGWRERTGIDGAAIVSVAVIDSHVVLPAVGAHAPGKFVGALGTSAAYLLLGDQAQPLPVGIEGMALGAALPGLWCYEAGQAGFGDVLAWFVQAFPRAETLAENFHLYETDAAALRPGANRLIALDWWSGNRVPFADSKLSGLIAGLNLSTSAADIYRALLESLCFGTRSILDHFVAGGLPVERIILTSGLSRKSPLLLQIMADVLGREVYVPDILNPTAVGAAIHGAVAAGIVQDYTEGATRFGVRSFDLFQPNSAFSTAYDALYRQYRDLSADSAVRGSMQALSSLTVFT